MLPRAARMVVPQPICKTCHQNVTWEAEWKNISSDDARYSTELDWVTICPPCGRRTIIDDGECPCCHLHQEYLSWLKIETRKQNG